MCRTSLEWTPGNLILISAKAENGKCCTSHVFPPSEKLEINVVTSIFITNFYHTKTAVYSIRNGTQLQICSFLRDCHVSQWFNNSTCLVVVVVWLQCCQVAGMVTLHMTD